ncbi:MAG: OmpA family protein [Sandaracinaceae bacterium]|nr:OmpA family protein [Sandaracinaceae bacterium]
MRSMAMLLVALVAVGCGYSEEEMQAKLGRISELEGLLQDARNESEERQTRIQALETQNSELGERLRALGQEVEGLESERGDLQSSLDETRRALEELRQRERQQAERLNVFRQMLERFASMIAAGRLRVRIVRNRMVIELQNDILFASGRAELQEAGEEALREIVGVLNSIQNRQFQVAGHTDNVPMHSSRFASNWELSTTRAVNVVQFMIENGMNAELISAAGYADTQPVVSNATPEGRAQNRRIEIVLVPNLDELPDLSSLMEGSS